MAQTDLAAHPLIDDAASLPLLPASVIHDFGPTVVVAPHPDDEALGCGGAIALLASAGIPVRVVFVSDGAGSHPGSQAYPQGRLAALRESEARASSAVLGVPAGNVEFLRLPDTSVPRIGSAGFAEATRRLRGALRLDSFYPRTILLPWRRDPHTDHRAAWELTTASLSGTSPRPRMLEYPIWIWEFGAEEDLPEPGEAMAWRLDISNALERKLEAIAAHRSQTTKLIDDDPDGFILEPHVLGRFRAPWELYLESLE